ncbi:MAG: 4-demethylwyosine synthase TYW1 [Candidatus Thorarchaeota archaeon]
MPTELSEKLEKQGYHLLGKRGAYKACQWQKKALLHDTSCYKQRFYGIESHRCLQMTPVVDKCTHNCEFCWRVTPSDIGVGWNQVEVSEADVIPVDDLMDAVLMANLRSLGGYNPEAGAAVPERKYREARDPKHVAISLAGEPTLHPLLSELIDEIHRRGMTSFLVTNGTRPDVLSAMTLPTQLYVTLAAPDEATYKTLCRPGVEEGWSRVLQSQESLRSLDTRTVNRLTMVSERNMHDVRAYSKLIELGEPDFIEVKGYMHLGSSRGRLSQTNSPSHREIRGFSEKLAALTGYYPLDEQVESRVVLLSRNKQIKKL